MAKHYTAMGKLIDMNQMMMAHQHKIALGNASLNARGDYLKNGVVVRTQEQIVEEFRAIKEKQDSLYSGLINIKDPLARHQAASLVENSQDFEPTTTNDELISDIPNTSDNKKRRKIVEAD